MLLVENVHDTITQLTIYILIFIECTTIGATTSFIFKIHSIQDQIEEEQVLSNGKRKMIKTN